MLDKIKKAMGGEKPDAELSTQLEATLGALELSKKEFAELSDKFAAASGEVVVLQDKLEKALSQLAQLETLAQEKAASEAEAKATARKEMVAKAVGTAKADSTFEAIKGLDDVSFDAVLAALKTSLETEEASPMFQEVGVSAEADVQEEQPVHFKTYIKK